MKWRQLGEGSYNIAFRSDDGNSVFKVALDDSPSDLPERSVRVWNLVNAHIQPPARLSRQKIKYQSAKGKWVTEWRSGWICPYIPGRQATDEEIRMALLGTFNRTGRIVADATASNNFLTMRDGKTVCIDIGHALEMDRRETAALIGLGQRKPSFTSLDTWDEAYDTKKGKNWLKEHKAFSPKAIKTVEALLFIKKYRPDITNVNFLKKSPKTIKLLADAHVKGTESLVNQALELLAEKRSPDLENTKQKCRRIFLEYLSRLGTVDEYERFIPHPSRQVYDLEYVQQTMELMRRINTARTCAECYAIVDEYVAALPPIDMSQVEAKMGKSELDTEWLDTLEALVEEVEELNVLTDIKNRCQIIFSGYLLSFGVEGFTENALPDDNEPSHTTSHYKTQILQTRSKEQIDHLFEALNHATTFEDMLVSLDIFAQGLPSIPSQEMTGGRQITAPEALLVSVNYCRVMVQSAIRAAQITPDSAPEI